jgi:hypothetical protein
VRFRPRDGRKFTPDSDGDGSTELEEQLAVMTERKTRKRKRI